MTSTATTPRSVSITTHHSGASHITTPRTPRAKTPRRDETLSFRASPPRERPLSQNWRQIEISAHTPRESRMRVREASGSVSQVFFVYLWVHSNEYFTEWRRPIGYLQLQVIFRKRTTNYRACLQKMTCKDKGFYGCWPPCMTHA